MKQLLITLLWIATATYTIKAQNFKNQQTDNKGRIIFAEIDNTKALPLTDANITLQLFKMSGINDERYSFKRIRSFKDEDGNEHIHYFLYYILHHLYHLNQNYY